MKSDNLKVIAFKDARTSWDKNWKGALLINGFHQTNS
jgi:hypothetical protein